MRAVMKRAQAEEDGFAAGPASIDAAVEGGIASRCVAVSADTTDDWCHNLLPPAPEP